MATNANGEASGLDDTLEPLQLGDQIGLLDSNARHLAARGLHEDAERLYREILRLSPSNLNAIRYLSTRHLARRELDQAQKLIERGIQLEYGNAIWHQHLGVVLRSRNYLDGALHAFDEAVRLDPGMAMAWIQRGDVLHALGRRDEGIASYCRAEALVGELAQAAADAAPKTRRVLQRAGEILRRKRIHLLDESLAAVRERHGKEALTRIEDAMFTSLGDRRPACPDPLQKPSGFYFPGLAARPFFTPSDFPSLRLQETLVDEMLVEYGRVAKEIPLAHPHPGRPEASGGASGDYYFYRYGERQHEAAAHCPKTMEVVESLPLPRLQGLVPTVRFSTLKPRTHLPPSYGATNFTLCVVLPLIAPKGCGMKVGDVTRLWARGKVLIYDDSFEHEYWNRSGELSVVLSCEIWHPEVTPAEREYLAAAQTGLENFRKKYAPQA